MFRSILVAVDNSAGAKKALEVAADMARQSGGKLTLVHAVSKPGNIIFEDPAVEAHEEALLRDAERLVSEASKLVSDLNPEVKMIDVPVAANIVKVAEEVGADVIVLGARRHGFFQDLLGSVSARVLHHTNCSVLIVRQN